MRLFLWFQKLWQEFGFFFHFLNSFCPLCKTSYLCEYCCIDSSIFELDNSWYFNALSKYIIVGSLPPCSIKYAVVLFLWWILYFQWESKNRWSTWPNIMNWSFFTTIDIKNWIRFFVVFVKGRDIASFCRYSEKFFSDFHH